MIYTLRVGMGVDFIGLLYSTAGIEYCESQYLHLILGVYNEILIYLSRYSEGALRDGYYSGDLIFEYSKTKPSDSSAYREFEDLWEETRGLRKYDEGIKCSGI